MISEWDDFNAPPLRLSMTTADAMRRLGRSGARYSLVPGPRALACVIDGSEVQTLAYADDAHTLLFANEVYELEGVLFRKAQTAKL
jgi:hypothetical protein